MAPCDTERALAMGMHSFAGVGKKYRIASLLAALGGVLASCGEFTVDDAHNNFIDINNRFVGWSIDRFDKSYGPDKAGRRELPNGNIENAYGYNLGKCMTFYEFDPETRIIVNWRFEGLKRHCGMGR